MKTASQKQTLSIKETSDYLGLSRASIYRLINAGHLPSVKLCGRRLIRRDAIDALLSSREGE